VAWEERSKPRAEGFGCDQSLLVSVPAGLNPGLCHTECPGALFSGKSVLRSAVQASGALQKVGVSQPSRVLLGFEWLSCRGETGTCRHAECLCARAVEEIK